MKPFLHSSVTLMLFCVILLAGCKKNLENKSTNGPAGSSNAIVEAWIYPATTDPAITTSTNAHFASVNEGAVLRNTLFVFLPGTNRTPSQCKVIAQKAVTMGYHSISLMYSNQSTGNGICKATGDTTCHRRLRLEVIDGIDRHSAVNITPTNSVINRLYKLLVYLNKTRPSQGWGQYILNGKPNWSKIVIGGHSQGGALSGLIGKHYPVKRSILLSIVDYLDNGKIPDWEKMPANNANFYSFTNMNDELIPWYRVKAVWAAAGWLAYGNYLNVDWNPSPYNNTHVLISTYPSTSTSIDKYHNMTGVDSYFPKYANGKYVYEKVWEYLLR